VVSRNEHYFPHHCYITVRNLGLLVTCRAEVGSSGGIFIGHPGDIFNVNVQLPHPLLPPPPGQASIKTACHAPLTHQLFPRVISFAH
jgi:hypothetical protein